VYGADAVRLFQAALVPALDDARIPVALAGADHVYLVARLEGFDRDALADFVGREVGEAELFENLLRLHARLFELAEVGLVDPLLARFVKPELDGGIAVFFHALDLHHGAGPRLHYRYGNDLPFR